MHDSFNGNNSRKNAYTNGWKQAQNLMPLVKHTPVVRNAFKNNAAQKAPTQPTTGYTGGAGGSSGRRYSSGSSGGSTGTTTTAASTVSGGNAYADWLDQQRAMIEAAAAAKRQAAQQAYDRGMSALGTAYGAQKDALQRNYDSSVGTMNESYQNGVNSTNQQADKTMNEAYINYMLSRRNLPQMLSAQGINGGAAESTMAGLANNYGNSRNEIDVNRNDTLGTLLEKFNANKASALQAMNSAQAELEQRKMAYQMQLEQALQEGIVSAANDRYDALASIGNNYLSKLADMGISMQDAADAAGAVGYTAGNTPQSVSVQQGSGSTGRTNYELVNRLFGQGYTTDDVISSLSAMGYTPQTIQQMLMGAA